MRLLHLQFLPFFFFFFAFLQVVITAAMAKSVPLGMCVALETPPLAYASAAHSATSEVEHFF